MSHRRTKRPGHGDERDQDQNEHEGDEASGSGFLFGRGPGDPKGVDERVDEKTKRIHKL